MKFPPLFWVDCLRNRAFSIQMFLLRCEKIQDGSKIVVQVLESRNGINLFLPFLPAKAWWFFLLFFFFLFLFWNVTVLLAAPNAIGTPLCLYINAMENIHGDYSEKWAVKKLCGACVQSEVGRVFNGNNLYIAYHCKKNKIVQESPPLKLHILEPKLDGKHRLY